METLQEVIIKEAERIASYTKISTVGWREWMTYHCAIAILSGMTEARVIEAVKDSTDKTIKNILSERN